MKNSMWDKAMVVLSGLATIASMVVFAILVASMITAGVTTMKIWGLVGIILSVLLSSILLGVLVYSDKKQRQPIIK